MISPSDTEGHAGWLKMTVPPRTSQPWSPSDATQKLNEMGGSPHMDLSTTKHTRDRLKERGLTVSDLLFVLRRGYVYERPEESTVKGLYKYKIEGQSPNSGSRYLRIIAVPDEQSCWIKVVTVMWRDES